MYIYIYIYMYVYVYIYIYIYKYDTHYKVHRYNMNARGLSRAPLQLASQPLACQF